MGGRNEREIKAIYVLVLLIFALFLAGPVIRLPMGSAGAGGGRPRRAPSIAWR